MMSSGEKYNTQELLSLNMDRLKKYMARIGRAVEDTSSPQVFEEPKLESKSATRILKAPTACNVLTLFDDPLHYVQLSRKNDERHPTWRYHLERAGDFKDLLGRMDRQIYDLILFAPASWVIDDDGNNFTSLDLMILLKGLMRASDVYFLQKKRWFVLNHIEGEEGQDKVDNFRRLKRDYQDVPMVYLHKDLDPRDEKALSNVSKVRLSPFDVDDPGSVLSKLDELTDTRPE